MTMVQAPESILATVLATGLARAGDALGALSGHEVTIANPSVAACSPAEVIDSAGGPDAVVVGVYVGITGSLTGHALLLLPPEGARRLAGILLEGMRDPDAAQGGPDDGFELDPLEMSALQEVGNVTISACLNELGRFFPIPVHPTIPQAIVELAGAILDAVLLDLVAESDLLLAARTTFTINGDHVDGTILILPDRRSLTALAVAIAAVGL